MVTLILVAATIGFGYATYNKGKAILNKNKTGDYVGVVPREKRLKDLKTLAVRTGATIVSGLLLLF